MNDEVKVEKKRPALKLWKMVVAFFGIGLAMGACTLGMKIPVALYDLAMSKVP